IVINGFWLLPESEPKRRVVEPIKVLWLFFRLDQNWSLFSPVIRNINYHTVAVVTYRDGFKRIWELPRMERLNWIDKFRKEKFRKWSVDSLPWEDHKEFWPYFARYVGRELYNAENPPAEFSLCLFWAPIPAPKETDMVMREKLPVHTKFTHVFTYKYQPEDFK
ncbi:MAG: hypothetical protein K2Z81_27940, partial [Cyanobacteria bacterium]|nr:hypothetical protein [Cyanobacteriota bacterium]